MLTEVLAQGGGNVGGGEHLNTLGGGQYLTPYRGGKLSTLTHWAQGRRGGLGVHEDGVCFGFEIEI